MEHSVLLGRVFWGLLAVEAIVFIGAMMVIAAGPRTGPEGPVGAIVLVFPPLVFLAVGLAVWLIRSDAVRVVGIVVLAWPLLIALMGPVHSAWMRWQVDRSLAGDDVFTRPAQRNLARALRSGTAADVRAALAQAGDLNAVYHDETLLWFAMKNVDDTEESVGKVQALLQAGANPNQPVYGNSYPLTLALFAGPRLVGALLDAGVDPNLRDGAERPLWWDLLSRKDEKGLATLDLLLARGADVRLRDRDGGPVVWARYHGNEEAVRRLLAAGAPND